MFTLFRSVNSMTISPGLIEGCRANYIICKDSYTLSYDNDSLCVVTVFWGKGKKNSNYRAVLESACQQQNSDL